MTGGDRSRGERTVDRRSVLGMVPTLMGAGIGIGPAGDSSETHRHRTVVFGTGYYEYVPFQVPGDVTEVRVSLRTNPRASVGVGLFDHRGAHYQSDGFRGVYGAERSEFFVRRDAASTSFLPGPMEGGTWTVIIPVFEAPVPTRVTVEVSITTETPNPPANAGPSSGLVDRIQGWYCGDLHCHTPASSDAWSTDSALSPAEWADTCREIGLDFVSLTDHNVISQNRSLRMDSGNAGSERNVLLIGGEEMTNWFHGHATVTGLAPGEWLDWRQRPGGDPPGARQDGIGRFFETAEELGTYTSVAHPTLALGNNDWDFWGDAATSEAARPDGLEVWNGPWTPEDESALELWDRLLATGWRPTANGGSDTHGTDDPTFGQAPGVPTTYVFASELSPEGIVDGLRAGRVFITRNPEGPELLLTATGPADQTATVGGEVAGHPSDVVTFEVTVRGGDGGRVRWIRDGDVVSVDRVDGDRTTVTHDQAIGPGGFVRVELRDRPDIRPDDFFTSRGAMAALTNPIHLVAESTTP